MKKKILWCGLSFLLVAALVLASCAKEEVVVEEEEEEEEEEVIVEEEEEEEEEEIVPAVGVPQRGGTVIHYLWGMEAPSADQHMSGWPAMMYTGPVMEFLLKGDAEKYGARGTDEYGFYKESTPIRYSKGAIAESWEITPDRDKLIFHIRPGIIWAAYGKEHVMEPRELTAEDVAWSMNRAIDGPMMGGWPKVEADGWIESIYAEGDTVVFKATEDKFVPLDINWRFLANGWTTGIYAPEVVEAGADDWDNLVGTGPFMFEEYVVGSHLSYIRNPHYWDTTTIDGVEYEIPFIDRLIYTMMPDEATRIAALRTGKLDVFYTVPLKYEDTLAQTTPELIQERWEMMSIKVLALRCDRPPFDNHEVRRAMMIALDLEALARAQYGYWDVWGWPAHTDTPAYIPIEELPARIQELYSYNPDLARQILADEDYPGGVVEIVSHDAGYAVDWVTMVAAYWNEIGVETALRVMEHGAFQAAVDAGDYDTTLEMGYNENVLDSLRMFTPPAFNNRAVYDNPEFTALYLEAENMRDEDEQLFLLQELSEMALDSVAYIPCFPADIGLCVWWPWLRNFYGEFAIADWNPSYAISTTWIDQDLKEAMGY